jgi:hypothetical protein
VRAMVVKKMPRWLSTDAKRRLCHQRRVREPTVLWQVRTSVVGFVWQVRVLERVSKYQTSWKEARGLRFESWVKQADIMCSGNLEWPSVSKRQNN